MLVLHSGKIGWPLNNEQAGERGDPAAVGYTFSNRPLNFKPLACFFVV